MLSGKIIRIWLILLTVALAALLIASCSSSTKPDPGKNPVNKAPKVEMVNIPPDNSHFTTNPVLYWFGTDVDGRVVAYEYAVVPCSLIAARKDTSKADSIIAYAKEFIPDSSWTVVNVVGSNNPNEGTIRIPADPNPKVSVLSYFFVRAVDNDGAKSNIDFRLYSRTNHPPDTEIKTLADEFGYYDMPETTLTYRGIAFEWKGTDKIDYPTDNPEPTFEFKYQVLGPFDEIPYKRSDVDTLRNVIDTARFEAGVTPDKLVEESVDTATNKEWVAGTTTRVHNLWRKQFPPPSKPDTTLSGWFVLRVVARDDAFVPDSTPAYLPFYAIYPRFENTLLVYIAGFGYTSISSGQIKAGHFDGPQFDNVVTGTDTIPVVSEYYHLIPFYRDVIAGAGYGNPPMLITTDNPTKVPAGVLTEKDMLIGTTGVPSRLLMARYKVILMISDGGTERFSVPKDKGTPSVFGSLVPYMDLGGNVWLWSPTPFLNFAKSKTSMGVNSLVSNPVPTSYFGVIAEYNAAWRTSYAARTQQSWRPFLPTNEEFVGGRSLDVGVMENFLVDTTKLNKTYLLDWPSPDHWLPMPCCVEYDADSNCIAVDSSRTCNYMKSPENYMSFRAAPHTGYFVPDVYSERLWLFGSCFGDNVPDSLANYVPGLNGKVIGLRYNSNIFKTAVFGFSLWMMEKPAAIDVFRKQMEWFLAP